MNCIIYSIITYYNLMQMVASTVQYLYSQSYELASLKGRSIYVAVEVRMRTLDQFLEIEFSTYSDITSLRLSLYHVLERKTLLRQSYRA